MPRILKDCFGTVISSLKKMKECVRCELLRECRSINWEAQEGEAGPVVSRRPGGPAGDAGPSSSDPSGAGAPSSGIPS